MAATTSAAGRTSTPAEEFFESPWYAVGVSWQYWVMEVLRSRSRKGALDFEPWADAAFPRLCQALTAAFGPEVAADAANEALAIAWQKWSHVSGRTDPMAYTFGIARNRARHHARRKPLSFPEVEAITLPDVEPGLPAALQTLSERQRVVVGLVHGYGWTLSEVADLLGLRKSSVQNHNERGLRRLRDALGVTS